MNKSQDTSVSFYTPLIKNFFRILIREKRVNNNIAQASFIHDDTICNFK